MMLGRALALITLALWGSAALAADFCLRPIVHTPPLSELEQRQPYRLASGTLTYPGFRWLVISPTNRNGLYTIRGDRYEGLHAPWPTSSMWEQGKYFVRPAGGGVYGIKHSPLALFKLAADGAEFQSVNLPAFNDVRYDFTSDRIIVWTQKDGAFWEVVEDALIPMALDPLEDMRNGAMPRYMPALSAWVAASKGRLYVAKEGQKWQRFSGGRARIALYQLENAPTHYDPETRSLAVRFGPVVLVYAVQDSGFPKLSYVVERVQASWFGGALPLVTVKGSPTTYWGQPRAVDRFDNLVQVLAADGVRDMNHVAIVKTPHPGAQLLGTTVTDRPVDRGVYHVPPLFRQGDETFFFDGHARVAVPQLSVAQIGKYPKWMRWQDRVFVLGAQGWAELMPDLSLRKAQYPVPQGQTTHVTEVTASARYGLMIAAKGELWRSTDGTTFEQLSDGSDGYVQKFISDLPGRPEALVLSKDGLMLLQEPCN